MTVRGVALLAHRYAGLFLAAFLILAGLTGTTIAFIDQLDPLVNPTFYQVQRPHPEAEPLPPLVLRERLAEQLPGGTPPRWLVLKQKPDKPVMYWVDGREVFLNPYTGDILGQRTWGDISEGKQNLLTFIYRLHFSLGLEEVGTLIFGYIALLWAIDCFVGAYLTFPAPLQRTEGKRPWLARWLPSWLLKTKKLFSLIFSWHRASGLWLWLILLIFAWSAVAINLREQVYRPVMGRIFGPIQDRWEELPHFDEPRAPPKLAYPEALELARRLMQQEASQRGFEIFGEHYMDYDAEHGSYSYTVESSLDISERLAETLIVFDGDTGTLHFFDAATGEHAGRTVTSWLIGLHFGALRVGGFAYRVFVGALGLLVVLLSISGVWIWWRKRPRAPRTPRERGAAR